MNHSIHSATSPLSEAQVTNLMVLLIRRVKSFPWRKPENGWLSRGLSLMQHAVFTNLGLGCVHAYILCITGWKYTHGNMFTLPVYIWIASGCPCKTTQSPDLPCRSPLLRIREKKAKMNADIRKLKSESLHPPRGPAGMDMRGQSLYTQVQLQVFMDLWATCFYIYRHHRHSNKNVKRKETERLEMKRLETKCLEFRLEYSEKSSTQLYTQYIFIHIFIYIYILYWSIRGYRWNMSGQNGMGHLSFICRDSSQKHKHAPGIAALPPVPAASDNVDTQPVDIMGAPVENSLLPSSSPDIPSSKIRASFHSAKRAKRKSPEADLPLATLMCILCICKSSWWVVSKFRSMVVP